MLPRHSRWVRVLKTIVVSLLGLVALAAIALGVGYQLVQDSFLRPGPLPAARALVVPKGNYDQVIGSLEQQGVLSSKRFDDAVFRFLMARTRSQGPLRAGEYLFPAHASAQKVLDILRHGKPILHRLTIPEGWTSRRIRAAMMDDSALSGTLPPTIAEGSVQPQTYSFERGMNRTALLHLMQRQMKRRLATTWQNRDQGALAGLVTTPQQLLVLASLVERETATPAERPKIARVFLNRLKLDMPLQTDPGTIYDLSGGVGTLPRPLTRADLKVPGPHNTYLNHGIPESPISAPGRAALEAVAHPAQGDWLYFVASGQGGHNFATTLSDHNHNVQHWHSSQNPTPDRAPAQATPSGQAPQAAAPTAPQTAPQPATTAPSTGPAAP
ncbi:endolytic transglycosylase MltG [Formicincola oecophyllae]|uniref:Endolytic murein transglycosylase n=2 Tax=Formicincola oecophyllae TaxID=2558361 RepID=A0A4Y6U9U0_9PROT|nr:endolytic transglycosylase MltG [Formicincola oecophyllae]